MFVGDSLSEGHRPETRSQRGFPTAPLSPGARGARIRHLRRQGRILVRLEQDEDKIRAALIKIRNHWRALVGTEFEPPDLSRKLACLEYMILE